MRNRLGADHDKAEHDGQRAGDAARRQRLLENEMRQHEATDGGAGRLNDAAVAERHIDVADVAPQRERQTAERRQRDAAAPAQAAETAKAGAGNER